MKKTFFNFYVIYSLAFIPMPSSCSKSFSGFSDHKMGFQDQDQESVVINFNETLFDFYIINQGQKVNHVFRFKNIDQSPLLIYDAKGKYGCTIPNHSGGPISCPANPEL